MLITGLLLFLLVYFIITLSDLECDYINAQQCCSRLNSWVIPKLIGQGMVTALFLVHGYLWMFAVTLPIAAWSFYDYWKVPKGNVGIYDPTEIHNRGQLKLHMRDVLINVAFHLIAFFVYVYCMIVSMLKADPAPGPAQLNDFDEF
jgi:hypothetical protein